MKVGCNGAIQVAVSFASVRQYSLTIEDWGNNAKAILGIDEAAVNVQTGGGKETLKSSNSAPRCDVLNVCDVCGL